MATGKPAITVPRTGDLRELQALVANIRERFQAVESALPGVSTAAPSTAQVDVSQLRGAVSALAQRLTALESALGGVSITVGPTAPSSPQTFDLWVDTT